MNITEAKILLRDLGNQKEHLTKKLQDIDQTILALKLEVANYVLGEAGALIEEDKEDEDKVPMVQIQFKTNGPIYDYLWTDYRKPEEYVYVEKFNSNEYQAVKCLGVEMKEPDPDLRYKVAYYEDPNE